jgi:hypothetical protein
MVKQTIHYVTKKSPPPEKDEDENLFITLAKEWVNNPTVKLANELNSVAKTMKFDIVHQVSAVVHHQSFDDPEEFLAPAFAAGAETGLDAAEIALTVAGAGYLGIGRQWQITVAWAILYGKKLPNLD